MKTIVSLSLIVAFISVMSGCKPSDQKISESVKTAMASDASLSPVSVSVKDGIVTLSGEVDSDEQKARAESSAAGVKGVKGVTNAITVRPQGPSPEELSRAGDEALQSKVQANFATYKVEGITARVEGGVVTLTGDITRDNLPNAMKAAMESGAVKVENQMTIK